MSQARLSFKKKKKKTQNALDLIDFKKDPTGIKSHFTSVKCPYKSRPLFLRKYNFKKRTLRKTTKKKCYYL